jgi:hypothetical protein
MDYQVQFARNVKQIPSQRILLKDTFVGTNGLAIDQRAMDVGPGWTVPNEGAGWSWILASGRAQAVVPSGAAAAWAFAQTIQSDGVVSATINVPTTAAGATGLVGRVTPVGATGSPTTFNCFLANIGFSTGALVIKEQNTLGGFTNLISVTGLTLLANTDYNLSFRFEGSLITATIAGIAQCSVVSTDMQTNLNFGIYAEVDGRFVSNFLVTDLA